MKKYTYRVSALQRAIMTTFVIDYSFDPERVKS